MKLQRIGLLLLIVLALVGAGCGGDDEEAAVDAEPVTTAETAGAGEGGEGEGGGTLTGSVGPGFDISVDGAEGLAPGDYTLVVNDQAAEHNFHLTGPGGVDVSTGVPDEGEEAFEITLEAGEYTFVCDPHASQMRGSFTVG